MIFVDKKTCTLLLLMLLSLFSTGKTSQNPGLLIGMSPIFDQTKKLGDFTTDDSKLSYFIKIG